MALILERSGVEGDERSSQVGFRFEEQHHRVVFGVLIRELEPMADFKGIIVP